MFVLCIKGIAKVMGSGGLNRRLDGDTTPINLSTVLLFKKICGVFKLQTKIVLL